MGDDAVAYLLHDVKMLENHDKIITTHMTYEICFGATFTHHGWQHSGKKKKNLVSLVEAIVFVVFLEVVKVDLHHCEILSISLAVAYLLANDIVARQSRQRIQIAV